MQIMNRRGFASFLAISGNVLLFSYAVAVITSAFPLRLLDPAWQLTFTSNAVDNGGTALIGLISLLLAGRLDARNASLRAHCERCCRLALLPMLGFLLIPMLQCLASVRLQEQVQSERVGRVERAGRVLEKLSKTITTSQSADQIDLVLRKFQGKGLTPQQRSLPVSRIRAQLLSQLDEARRQLQRRIPDPQALQPAPLILTGLRVSITALAYAFAFAAVGRRHGATISVLEELHGLNQQRRLSALERRNSREAFLKSLADARLEQQAIAAEQSLTQPLPAEPAGPTPATKPARAPEPAMNPRGGVDLDYFEQLSRGLETDTPDP